MPIRAFLPIFLISFIALLPPLQAEEEKQKEGKESKEAMEFWFAPRSENTLFNLSREVSMLPKGWRMAIPECVVCFYFGDSGFVLIIREDMCDKEGMAKFIESVKAPAAIDFKQEKLDVSWDVERDKKKVTFRILRFSQESERKSLANSLFTTVVARKDEMERSKDDIEKVLCIIKDEKKWSELCEAHRKADFDAFHKEYESKKSKSDAPTSKSDDK